VSAAARIVTASGVRQWLSKSAIESLDALRAQVGPRLWDHVGGDATVVRAVCSVVDANRSSRRGLLVAEPESPWQEVQKCAASLASARARARTGARPDARDRTGGTGDSEPGGAQQPIAPPPLPRNVFADVSCLVTDEPVDVPLGMLFDIIQPEDDLLRPIRDLAPRHGTSVVYVPLVRLDNGALGQPFLQSALGSRDAPRLEAFEDIPAAVELLGAMLIPAAAPDPSSFPQTVGFIAVIRVSFLDHDSLEQVGPRRQLQQQVPVPKLHRVTVGAGEVWNELVKHARQGNPSREERRAMYAAATRADVAFAGPCALYTGGIATPDPAHEHIGIAKFFYEDSVLAEVESRSGNVGHVPVRIMF
jgi:hypothetical protein